MNGERRRRPRLKVRCGLHLSRVNNHIVVRTETEDLNSEGFYCTSDRPFSPGEQLECELLIPVKEAGVDGTSLVLRRRAKVVRVEIRGIQAGFGLACQFETQLTETTLVT